jgi:hypothetical protein
MKRQWLRFRCYNTKEHSGSRLYPKRLICSSHSKPVASAMHDIHQISNDSSKEVLSTTKQQLMYN